MNAAEIAKLVLVLAPVAANLAFGPDGVTATMRTDMTPEGMVSALKSSKSAHWPELTFGQETPK